MSIVSKGRKSNARNGRVASKGRRRYREGGRARERKKISVMDVSIWDSEINEELDQPGNGRNSARDEDKGRQGKF